MRAQIRLILSTLALTVLIWAYADRAGHVTTDINVPITILPADSSNRLVFRVVGAPAEEPNVVHAELALRGPKRAIATLRGEYERNGFPLTVVVREELRPGRYTRNLFNDLSTAPEILQPGLMLEGVSPTIIEFDVDRYKLVTVPLEADAGSYSDDLEAPPTITPSQVTARVVESKLSEGLSLPPLTVALDKGIAEAIKNRPRGSGGPLEFTVTLRSSWPGIDAAFTPPTVQVRVRLKWESTIERINVRPLGVLVKTPDFFDGYEIVWEDEAATKAQIAYVRVPVTKLDRLRELESNTQAYVVIDDADLPRETTLPLSSRPATTVAATFRPKPVQFHFPTGFEDVRLAEGQTPTVSLRVQPKNGGPAAEPAAP